MTTPAVVSVDGTASDGDAGIQSDLKVFGALRCHGTAVVTAAIAGTEVYPMPAHVVRAQLDVVLAAPPAAVKVGVVADADTAGVVAARARAGLRDLVLDPVLVHPPGRRASLVAAYRRLVAHATVVTAGLDEATALAGWPVLNPADMAGAASKLAGMGAGVVVISGDLSGGQPLDVVWVGNGVRQLRGRQAPDGPAPRAGDAFAAAIAAHLAHGLAPVEAVEYAARWTAQRSTEPARPDDQAAVYGA